MSMNKFEVWESLNGECTHVSKMSTHHLCSAIKVVERNDVRYGPKHGAALPAMLEERRKRAERGDMVACAHEPDFRREPDSISPERRAYWSALGIEFVAPRKLPRALPESLEMRLQALESQCAGGIRVAFIDERAGRAHRRIDKIEETLRATTNFETKVRLTALETNARAHATDLAIALARIAELEKQVLDHGAELQLAALAKSTSHTKKRAARGRK